jgi:F-type H+-transporting ATPase subunit b
LPSSHYRLTRSPRALVVCAFLVACLAAGAPLSAQHAPGAQPRATGGDARAQAAVDEHARQEPHEDGWLSLGARLVNFGLLAGLLVYYLRAPIVAYLHTRGTQIRAELVSAAEMRRGAEQELAEIDRRLAALPRELEALRARGAAEAVAEEARIRAQAEHERQRLLEQTRREIDLQLRVARRDLTRLAAELATGVAAERLRRSITAEDQMRLIDRYMAQVQEAPSTR